MSALLWSRGECAESLQLAREAADKRLAVLGGDAPETPNPIINVGYLLCEMGEFAESERHRDLADDQLPLGELLHQAPALRCRGGRVTQAGQPVAAGGHELVPPGAQRVGADLMSAGQNFQLLGPAQHRRSIPRRAAWCASVEGRGLVAIPQRYAGQFTRVPIRHDRTGPAERPVQHATPASRQTRTRRRPPGRGSSSAPIPGAPARETSALLSAFEPPSTRPRSARGSPSRAHRRGSSDSAPGSPTCPRPAPPRRPPVRSTGRCR